MLSGSCACGCVTYEIQSTLFGPVNYCHCWQCRKHSGSSFGTTASVRSADFTVVTGLDRISFWASSPGIRRYFAACCGSPLYKTSVETPDEIRLRMGTLDTDPGVKVEMHYMVGSKAPWVSIEDALPQELNGAPFSSKGEHE
jgi:hypothetical protein